MSERTASASQRPPFLGLKPDVGFGGLADAWYLRSVKAGMRELVSAACLHRQKRLSLAPYSSSVVFRSQNDQGDGAIAHREDLRYYSCRNCIRGADVPGS